MNEPVLDLVRERIDHGLEEAQRVPLLAHVGLWFGVISPGTAWSEPTGIRRYSDVAEAGAALAAGNGAARPSFECGIAWLRQRRFFIPGQVGGLEADPLALLGLALGVSTFGGADDERTWLAGIIRQALENEYQARRAEILTLALELTSPKASEGPALSPILEIALAKKGPNELPPETQRAALDAILTSRSLEPEWAVIHAAALDNLFAMEAAVDFTRPMIEHVVDLLRGVPAALKRWPWEHKPKTQGEGVTAQRWDIQHEYHVQSLLWAVLRPVFPELEDEEHLPSLGPKQPRADLLVPGLRVVIEVKYLRQASQRGRARILEEVAADSGLYLTERSGYDRMIVFVWDATRSTHHHDEIATGLKRVRGVHEVIVVSRPGDWAKAPR